MSDFTIRVYDRDQNGTRILLRQRVSAWLTTLSPSQKEELITLFRSSRYAEIKDWLEFNGGQRCYARFLSVSSTSNPCQ